MTFHDHFSERAEGYSRFRPGYPESLFRFLASKVSDHELAWDCATGNGQSAAGLSPYFQRVIATDASHRQIQNSQRIDRVFYCISLAEETPLKPSSVDLITVSQALHWLRPDPFFAEAGRVLKPSGLFAAWMYKRAKIQPDLDRIMDHYYTDIVGPYWPPERKLLEMEYRTIPFPFQEETGPEFEMLWEWNLAELTGYIRTWSASQRYTEQRGSDPLLSIEKDLLNAWGDPEMKRRIRWPLTLRIGRPR